jgi:Bul1 C terminus
MPMDLPPAACASVEKDTKVLLPSFESCMVTRSYEVEVKIGFEGGDVVLRVPTSIITKPATSLEETALETAIRAADNWTPPGREATDEVRPQPLRPTALELATDDIQPVEEADEEESRAEAVVVASPTPPDYELLVSVDKYGVSQRVTALAA